MIKAFVSAVFGAAFTLFVLSSVSAAPPPGLEKYMQAQAEFQQMMADAKAGKGEVPRLSDPKAAEVLRILSDVDGVLGTQTYEWNDFLTLSGMCGTRTLFNSYLFFGAKPFEENDGESEIMEMAEIGDRNRALYRDEMTALGGFFLACQPRLFALLDEEVSRFNRREKPGLFERDLYFRFRSFQMRAAFDFAIVSLLMPSPSEGGQPSKNGCSLLQAGARVADDYARVMSKEQRADIVSEAERLRPTLEAAAQTDLDVIVRAMQRTDCEGLCALQMY